MLSASCVGLVAGVEVEPLILAAELAKDLSRAEDANMNAAQHIGGSVASSASRCHRQTEGESNDSALMCSVRS